MGDNQPYQKIVFGTDVEVEMMEDVLNDYHAFMDYVKMSEADRALVMGETAARIFGVK